MNLVTLKKILLGILSFLVIILITQLLEFDDSSASLPLIKSTGRSKSSNLQESKPYLSSPYEKSLLLKSLSNKFASFSQDDSKIKDTNSDTASEPFSSLDRDLPILKILQRAEADFDKITKEMEEVFTENSFVEVYFSPDNSKYPVPNYEEHGLYSAFRDFYMRKGSTSKWSEIGIQELYENKEFDSFDDEHEALIMQIENAVQKEKAVYLYLLGVNNDVKRDDHLHPFIGKIGLFRVNILPYILQNAQDEFIAQFTQMDHQVPSFQNIKKIIFENKDNLQEVLKISKEFDKANVQFCWSQNVIGIPQILSMSLDNSVFALKYNVLIDGGFAMRTRYYHDISFQCGDEIHQQINTQEALNLTSFMQPDFNYTNQYYDDFVFDGAMGSNIITLSVQKDLIVFARFMDKTKFRTLKRTFSSQTKTWDWIYADNGPVIMRNVTLNYFTADLKFINHNKLLMISASGNNPAYMDMELSLFRSPSSNQVLSNKVFKWEEESLIVEKSLPFAVVHRNYHGKITPNSLVHTLKNSMNTIATVFNSNIYSIEPQERYGVVSIFTRTQVEPIHIEHISALNDHSVVAIACKDQKLRQRLFILHRQEEYQKGQVLESETEINLDNFPFSIEDNPILQLKLIQTSTSDSQENIILLILLKSGELFSLLVTDELDSIAGLSIPESLTETINTVIVFSSLTVVPLIIILLRRRRRLNVGNLNRRRGGAGLGDNRADRAGRYNALLENIRKRNAERFGPRRNQAQEANPEGLQEEEKKEAHDSLNINREIEERVSEENKAQINEIIKREEEDGEIVRQSLGMASLSHNTFQNEENVEEEKKEHTNSEDEEEHQHTKTQ